MRKKYELEAWCNVAYCDSHVVCRLYGRYYCAKHDPLSTPQKKAKKPGSAADRAKKTAAQKRWREKKKKEHAELVALRKSKPESEQDGMSRYIGFDKDDER